MKLRADVLERQVEAERQAGLAQQAGACCLCQDVTVELDTDRSRAAVDVDRVERRARMAGDGLVLLVPAVEGVEVELHVAGQVVVREPESGGGAVTNRTGSPEAVWTANGIPGCSRPATSSACVAAGDSCARMSSTGTA